MKTSYLLKSRVLAEGSNNKGLILFVFRLNQINICPLGSSMKSKDMKMCKIWDPRRHNMTFQKKGEIFKGQNKLENTSIESEKLNWISRRAVWIQSRGALRTAERTQNLNIIVWPHNPTVNTENTGFIIWFFFFSTGMFVSISLLSDSWLWKMSWEGVPFLILSLESSQTRFVPVSTSFIIPTR